VLKFARFVFKDAAGNPLPVGLVDGNAAQILNQLAAVGITIALAVIGTFVVLKIVDFVFGVRVSEEEEIQGLDLSQHGEEGYNLDLDHAVALAAAESQADPVSLSSAVALIEQA